MRKSFRTAGKRARWTLARRGEWLGSRESMETAGAEQAPGESWVIPSHHLVLAPLTSHFSFARPFILHHSHFILVHARAHWRRSKRRRHESGHARRTLRSRSGP